MAKSNADPRRNKRPPGANHFPGAFNLIAADFVSAVIGRYCALARYPPGASLSLNRRLFRPPSLCSSTMHSIFAP